MKRLLSILLSLLTVIFTAFAFVGCGDGQSDEGTTEPEGELQRFVNAYDIGLIDELDLKSIACRYYEWRGFEDNPYSGMWEEPAEGLSKETENKIRQSYFIKSENIVIDYFGVYDNNIVVTIDYEVDGPRDYDGHELNCDGIVFHKYAGELYVYHYPEQKDPSLEVTGKLYYLKEAYENELLTESDLKSISCYFYDWYEYEENPYSGMYEQPTQKLSMEIKAELKKACAEQISEDSREIKIVKYYGTYNGNIVVSMTGFGCVFPDKNSVVEIGGVTFIQDCWTGIFVYKK